MTTRTVAECPVGGCPWEYTLTTPRTKRREGGGTAVVLPPPAGVGASAAAAGVRAARQVWATAHMHTGHPARGGRMASLVELISRAANAQDDAVVRAHLAGHSRLQLQATFGDQADELFRPGVTERPRC